MPHEENAACFDAKMRRQQIMSQVSDAIDKHIEVVNAAEAAGKFSGEERMGFLIEAMMRGLHRIADLPDERELTDDEVRLFQSSLLQIAINASQLLIEMPFDPATFVIAGFDTDNPQ